MKKAKKIKIKHTQKVAWDMSELYLNTSSPLHCDKCKSRLGILHIIRCALFKKQGEHYFAVCKNKDCRHINRRIKGNYKDEVNEKWKDLELEIRKQKED